MASMYIRYPTPGGGGGGTVSDINGAAGPSITITGGTGISVGTIGNTITITNTGGAGTVTNVTGSAPISSSGGTTPNISISQSGVATDGYLSSTDWNTFNNKQPAGSYATTTLNNLGTTSINSDLIPSANNTLALGTTAKTWSNVFAEQYNLNSNANVTTLKMQTPGALPSGTSTNAGIFTGGQLKLGVYTDNDNTANAGATGLLNIETGNKTAGTGNSGSITLQTGTSSGGTRGSISLSSLNVNLNATNQISANSVKIVSLADPTLAQDAATKNYVDTVASQLNPAQATYAATTTNLVGTYANGAAGIGATFTITATGAFTLDGTTPPITSRILIKDQTSGFQNGIYNLTVTGGVAVSPILTRALDYNTPASINAGDLIPVINGTVNAGTTWLQTATITTIGTDSLTFVEWAYNPANFLLKANNLSDVSSPNTSFNNIAPSQATHSGQFLTTDGSNTSWATVTSGINQLTGDVTAGPGTGSQVATLANVGTPGTYVKVTTNAKGLVTSGSASPLGISDGGTGQTTKAPAFDALSPMTTGGDLIYGGTSGTGTRLPNGSSGQVLTSSGGTGAPAWMTPATPTIAVATITQQVAPGTNGGTFTSGAWQTRALNTLVDPSSIVTSFASSQFTLSAGTYKIWTSAPAVYVGKHKTKLRDITNSGDALIGAAMQAATGSNEMNQSIMVGIITPAGSTTYELQHQCETTTVDIGFGTPCAFSADEVYAQVVITKIG